MMYMYSTILCFKELAKIKKRQTLTKNSKAILGQ